MGTLLPPLQLADIACNQRGYLAPAQYTVLNEAARSRLGLGASILVGAIFIVGPLALAVVSLSQGRNDSVAMAAGMVTASVIGAGVLLRFARMEVRGGSLRREIGPQARVVRVAARAVWRNGWLFGRYVLEVVDASGAIASAHAPLTPGPYWCYVLPNSRILVGAESTVVPQGAWSVSQLPAGGRAVVAASQPHWPGAFRESPHIGDWAELLRALGAALHFNGEDLMRNRSGRMSARQIHRLVFGPAILALLAVGIAAFIAVLLLDSRDQFEATSWFFEALPAVLLCAYLWLIRAAFGGEVIAREGILERRIETIADDSHGLRSDTQRNYLVLGFEKFPVSDTPMNALVTPLRYRIYLAAKTRQLLSVDPLPPPDSNVHRQA